MIKGYVQVYTGDGKGKTTAAMGLALRAVCAGKKVIMIQFIKGMAYSELRAPEFLPGFRIEQHGRDCFINRAPEQADIDCAVKGLARLREAASSGEYDVVIADEINIALYYKLFSVRDALDILNSRAEGTELILTGRRAPREIIDAADLVTEMKEVRHYYNEGVLAREGIEM
ncbi:MAG: cob(I)yrinic acid a,c-diamide adenosyltransferase [Gracilibacteraceae bacterium]|jgi:cob(I)alamin adenosyltransferase|nr:cob(I)yrinic acid a,c-diamide adenosyltransferase [Gracilibacteraceae bacterium]